MMLLGTIARGPDGRLLVFLVKRTTDLAEIETYASGLIDPGDLAYDYATALAGTSTMPLAACRVSSGPDNEEGLYERAEITKYRVYR